MSTSDEGPREIQLNGKQLVFLFMAVTVVSVVIFLCGVLVGRGVQGRTGPIDAAAATPADPLADANPSPPGVLPPGPTKAEGLGYADRLESVGPSSERLVTPAEAARKAQSAAPPPPPASTSSAIASSPSVPAPRETAPRAAPPAEARQTVDLAPLPAEPKGDGFAIQVAALRGRSESDAVVTRLRGKGYAAYLVASLSGQPASFRVRVGKFKTRREAEAVAARLEREEQFKPWITR